MSFFNNSCTNFNMYFLLNMFFHPLFTTFHLHRVYRFHIYFIIICITIDRDFKSTPDHWRIIVQYMDEYPFIVTNKFSHSGGDKQNQKEIWEKLVNHLNSLGLGTRSVDKWQAVSINNYINEIVIFNDI